METRRRVWLRDGAHCVDCGALVDITPGTEQAFELDHEVPLWAGGLDDDSNRRCRCIACHAEKTAREAGERARIGMA